MGDEESRPALGETMDRLLNDLFVRGIDAAGGLVEQEDGRVLQ